ncbi:MAG: porin [Gemmatimonadaceae bacterium]|nr:porin [Gemmatimonadaceae bacterium]
MAVTRPHARATLILQAGTSVQANYASEPRNGTTSGPELARHLQEAAVGVQVAPTLWIDGGIYASYIGLEGWTSADNPTYTRSFVAEFSPYYLSGLKATWQATSRISAQLHVTNGWQNISEDNRSKAIGTRIDVAVTPTTTLTYANFLGNERPSGERGALRVFNQVMAKGTLPSGTEWQGQIDVGAQQECRWYGAVVIARHPLSSRAALVGRVERYTDPDQVIVATALADGFVANGASLGLDVALDGGVRWRSEVRAVRASDELFPVGSGTQSTTLNRAVTTSLAFAF